jgi:hypothetical protein
MSQLRRRNVSLFTNHLVYLEKACLFIHSNPVTHPHTYIHTPTKKKQNEKKNRSIAAVKVWFDVEIHRMMFVDLVVVEIEFFAFGSWTEGSEPYDDFIGLSLNDEMIFGCSSWTGRWSSRIWLRFWVFIERLTE